MNVNPMLDPVDLAVVGGGPVGVITALLAARQGLRTVVIERATEVYDLPRAVGMDDEIQRVFQGLDLLDELRGISTPLPGAEFVDTVGTRLNGFEFPLEAAWPLGHHPMVTYHQPELEQFLRREAAVSGVELRLGETVRAVDQDADRAVLAVACADGSVVSQPARWVVAADGAASPTRKMLGIEFEDAGFDQSWLVVDTELLHDDVELPRLAQQICDPARPVTFVPGHGNRRRWELQLQPGEDPEEMERPERVWELVSSWLSPADARLGRAVVYRFHATVAARFRCGRVFLAGDAAHQMPPFMGQGLCSGIRDAANLTWKLGLVQRGQAGAGLLDSYERERRPHARAMVDYAADTGRLIDQLSGRAPTTDDTADAGYGGVRPFPHLLDGILASDHHLRGRQLPQPVVGGRALDDYLGRGFTLLARRPTDVSDDVRSQWAAIGGTIAVVDDPGLGFLLSEGAVAIVRPDRYVAAVTTDPDELRRVSAQLLAWFAPAGAAPEPALSSPTEGTHHG